MPLSIVVGGQYGSEGKGKVTLDYAKHCGANIAVRVGGMNSGHTVYKNGQKFIFKTLPTPTLLKQTVAVIPSGAYFSVENLLKEITMVDVSKDTLKIDPYSVVITADTIDAELKSGLVQSIGSTGSGTGRAVADRILRNEKVVFAKDIPELKTYLTDSKQFMRSALNRGEHIVVEGTQGFGLSLLHSNMYPHVTSRDTTAAGFLTETGLSPLDVTDVVMVLRAFPIRVAGNSGPLANETSWEKITQDSGTEELLQEYTTVTKKIRRVASFDTEVVKQAILVNRPTKIVLNHVDYIDRTIYNQSILSPKAKTFVNMIESQIECRIDYIGTGEYKCNPR